MSSTFAPVFSALREILKRHAGRLSVKEDSLGLLGVRQFWCRLTMRRSRFAEFSARRLVRKVML